MSDDSGMATLDVILAAYMERYWGYGDLSASYWFIGPEEGGGSTWKDIERHLRDWEAGGRTEMTPMRPTGEELARSRWFGDAPKLQPYWEQVCRIYLAAQGKPCDRESVRQYQARELATTQGDTCLLELLPLPSSSTTAWLYGDHSEIPTLRSRRTYRQAIIATRTKELAILIRKHRPAHVIFLGTTHLKEWSLVAGVDLQATAGAPPIAVVDGVRMVVSRHPNNRGVRNGYFEELGRALTRTAVEPQEP